MIRSFANTGGQLSGPNEDISNALWLDLLNPEREEEKAVEALLGLEIPTREEMEEIEISSRLYLEGVGAYMTAVLPAHADGDDPAMAPVSFVLTPEVLVTVRYHEPRAFVSFPPHAERTGAEMPDAESVLVALIEAIVDRLADILERAAREIDVISRRIFRPSKEQSRDNPKTLEEIGRKGDLTSNIRDSLLTLERLASFLGQVTVQRKSTKELRDRVKTLSRDIRSLLDHAGFLSQKVTFLLDATLGMINIEQNAIIKIFSVAAVIFLPPTLIASIYGMNFEHMPELGWMLGYPFAIGLMIVSATLPYAFFKRRGWL
ncbi:magnesium transporter [Roseovarius tolerans]|uniref:Magnesium transport protein CorA n=1 Tax=Roseovarius tolerans TaxID=74031 RepID=A0A1H8IVT2_9RHOB|nr:magnesium transporter CorA family protein [Roseovarius tolerans]SEN71798.1 magnesium transporter [Roseovarius tolerans]